MTPHKFGTREEWLAARNELLERENKHAQRSEELARKRQELPWVPVEKEYSFETDGPVAVSRSAPIQDRMTSSSLATSLRLERSPGGRS
jgi:predicted dithiol-disulfide oxidoreductase (DUF899 family)